MWHPKDFEVDYRILLNKTDAILGDKKTKVFLGTIPLITIAPLIKGVGESYTIHIDEQDLIYFKYYTYFPFDEKYAFKSGNNLNFAEVMHIDNCIREYNKTIKKLVEEHNQKTPNRYFIMDISKVLDQMAFKRNDANPTYQFPDYFQFQFPMPNTKYYHADTNGNLKQGGIFSLDGVHPSAIAHGIIAYEILKVMQNAGVQDANPNNLDWKAIFDSDLLYKSPITVMHEIYDNSKLIELILYITKKMTC